MDCRDRIDLCGKKSKKKKTEEKTKISINLRSAYCSRYNSGTRSLQQLFRWIVQRHVIFPWIQWGRAYQTHSNHTGCCLLQCFCVECRQALDAVFCRKNIQFASLYLPDSILNSVSGSCHPVMFHWNADGNFNQANWMIRSNEYSFT